MLFPRENAKKSVKKVQKSAKWPRHHGSGSFLQLKPRFRTFFRTSFALFSHFFTLFSQFSKQSWLFGKIVFSLGKMRKKCEKSVKKVRKKCEKNAKKVQKSAKKMGKLGFSCKKEPRTVAARPFCTFFALFSHFIRIFSREKHYFPKS